jgi:hypothetical protein
MQVQEGTLKSARTQPAGLQNKHPFDTLRALCKAAEILSAAGEREDPALAREIRARVVEYDPALASASLDEICDAVRRQFPPPSELGTFGVLPTELIHRIMEEPGALRLGTASSPLYGVSRAVIETHRSRCRRAAAPLPMEARCIDEKPGIDCLRACLAAFKSGPYAVIEMLLRNAFQFAGVDVDSAAMVGHTLRLPLRPFRPRYNLPESLRDVEWPLVFQYASGWGNPPSYYMVRLELRSDSPFPRTRTYIRMHLNQPSDMPWIVNTFMINDRDEEIENTFIHYASWAELMDHIWSRVITITQILPSETQLQMIIKFDGRVNILYDFMSGDLNTWIDTVKGIFKITKKAIYTRVYTYDGRYGSLELENVETVDALEEWARRTFQRARSHTLGTTDGDLALDCLLEFIIFYYTLRAGDILQH